MPPCHMGLLCPALGLAAACGEAVAASASHAVQSSVFNSIYCMQIAKGGGDVPPHKRGIVHRRLGTCIIVVALASILCRQANR